MVRSWPKVVLRRLLDSAAFRWIEAQWYQAVTAGPSRDGQGVLLITTYGSGNIGDQAMFESFLRNTPGHIKAVMPSADAFVIPPDDAGRVEVHVLDGLFQGAPQMSPRRIRRLGNLIRESKALVVVGADIADGAYNLREAWSRAEALRLAVRLEVPARVIGFSWSDSPHPAVLQAYRRLSDQVQLFARDKYSHNRLHASGISAKLVADTVFSLPVESLTSSIFRHDQPLGPLAILNVSGLLRRRGVKAAEYVAIGHELLRLGYRILLLPHVFRENDNDLKACREVLEAFAGADVDIVEKQLSPSEVQALAASAAMVITGRMHLAILALAAGTPAIVFGSQGKVEGMLALFGMEEMTVEPNCRLSTGTIERIEYIHRNHRGIRQRIAETLPAVVEDANGNFVW